MSRPIAADGVVDGVVPPLEPSGTDSLFGSMASWGINRTDWHFCRVALISNDAADR